MDKPHEIELLEKFIKLENKLGRSKEDLIERLENSVLYIIEKRIADRLSRIESMALPKIKELMHGAISDEVSEYLS